MRQKQSDCLKIHENSEFIPSELVARSSEQDDNWSTSEKISCTFVKDLHTQSCTYVKQILSHQYFATNFDRVQNLRIR